LHGLEVYMLLDSGCTFDSISPEFATSMNLKVHELGEPVPLQLGTMGSHLKINFGLFTEFKIGESEGKHYFNVVNNNRYDTILGTVFMRKHRIVLNFELDEVQVADKDRPHSRGMKLPEPILMGPEELSGPLTEKDLPCLREEWKSSCQDILNGVPNTLPPLREINHHIPLVDEKKRYNYHLPKCPDLMRKPLAEKISCYCKVGWWCPTRAEK
ncbi:hypothetical protein L208DRAFT_1172585, partial [Tricholoma matsutake]